MTEQEQVHDVTAFAHIARRAALAERERIVRWLRETYSPAAMADRIEAGEHEEADRG